MYIEPFTGKKFKNHCGELVHVPIVGNDLTECTGKLRSCRGAVKKLLTSCCLHDSDLQCSEISPESFSILGTCTKFPQRSAFSYNSYKVLSPVIVTIVIIVIKCFPL